MEVHFKHIWTLSILFLQSRSILLVHFYFIIFRNDLQEVHFKHILTLLISDEDDRSIL